MGCCQSDQSSPSRPSALSLEPPQSSSHHLSISQQLLLAQAPTPVLLLCQQLLEALQTQHSTAKSTIDSAASNLEKYRELAGQPPLFGLEWPKHAQELMRGKREELLGQMRTLAVLRKETVLKWEQDRLAAEEKVREEEGKEAELEKEIESISDNRKKKQAQTILSELKTSNSLAKSTLETINLTAAETLSLVAAVPSLLQQYQALLWIDPQAKEEGIGYVEEVMTYEIEGEEVEMLANEEIVEGEVAAEVQEEFFATLFDQIAEDKDRIRDNALRKLYQRQKEDITDYYSENYMYELMEAIIAAKAKADAESEYTAQALDLFTVQYCLSLFPDSPIKGIVRLMNGIYAMKQENRPFMDFYTQVFAVFTDKPFPKAVVSHLPFLSVSLTLFRQSGSDQRALEGGLLSPCPPLADLVHITDAAELLYRLLDETYQEGIGPALELLRPEKVEELDYMHFLLIHRMKYRDLDGISLFKYMCGAKSTLNNDEFNVGIRSILKLALSEAVLTLIYSAIKSAERETIHRVDFIKFLRLWAYHRAVFSMDMMVERCRVLQVLAGVYAEIRENLVMKIRVTYRSFEDETGLLPRSQLDSFLQSLGESRDPVKLQASIKRDKEKLDFQEVITLLERFQAQPYATAFFNCGVEKKLEEEEIPREIVKMLAMR